VQLLNNRNRSGAVTPHGEDPSRGRYLEDQIPVIGNGHDRYRADLPMMALKGRLTSATLNWTFSVRKFSSIPNVTGSAILPRGYTGCGPTLENRREGPSQDPGICSYLNAAWLMTLSLAPPSIRTWCSRMLAMTGAVMSGSITAPAMFSGQSDAPKEIVVLLHR
jgi:hypothetical protein